ncbi:MAG: hypothetical protein KatS3mg105_0628 [Gemmatales bacterium]|nr:MAG: hypothetical protein KatS3mg105_0628 [Gemmatales bacterium]
MPEPIVAPAYLVVDTESVPDGKLLKLVKYPDDEISTEEAISLAQQEALERSGSDFLPVSMQYPVAVCVARVGADFRLHSVTCLDAPQFRPRQIVEDFWRGVALYQGARLVTFNGRCFDMPLLELAAFRYGVSAADYFRTSRHRYAGHLDLMDWLTNYGAFRLSGGLNLLSKILGKPGKMSIAGDQVYSLYQAGKLQEINDYCMADTLDTYFVFLRTRVLTGEISLARETELVQEARAWISEKARNVAALASYLANWGDWQPWP